MNKIEVRVLTATGDGLEVGSEPCACGGCRPTATIYEDDPRYERHDPALAQGPCCCGRFFVVALEPEDAESRARAMAAARAGLDAYRFEQQRVPLPWGGSFAVVVGELRE